MFDRLKSIGSKAINSLPVFSSKTKILTPIDPNLQDKLKQICNKILKAQHNDQFKIYQQLQSLQNSNFNRNLRQIYQHEQCTTQTINTIIRFYTFLLTNTKNQLVICKLVSQPLVIQLTKIVLQIQCEQQTNKEEEKQKNQVALLLSLVVVDYQNGVDDNNLQQLQQLNLQEIVQNKPTKKQSLVDSLGSNIQQQDQSLTITINTLPQTIDSLHYINSIDWDQVNSYKVALIRSYINCINPQTIKYMIINNQLPIFVNCVIGYKHYLSDGVEGTCISNCILMILTKINHNDQVCEIIFDQRHNQMIRNKMKNEEIENGDNSQLEQIKRQQNNQQQRQSLSKSISKEQKVKLHDFVKQVIETIGLEMDKVLLFLQVQFKKEIEQQQNEINSPLLNQTQIQLTLKQYRKLQQNMQFIQSNILFCVDLINSINNYNYTRRIKQNIGQSIEKQLIQKIIQHVQKLRQGHGEINKNNNNKLSIFQQTIMKLMRFVLNLSISCQKEQTIINFLNKNTVSLLKNIILLNQNVFTQKKDETTVNQNSSQQSQSPSKVIIIKTLSSHTELQKQCLTYICNFSLILLKQVISPSSKLASRKRLEINHQILQLKENILTQVFALLEQIVHSQQLKQGMCFKAIRNLLLCVFYLTIKEDKCSLGVSSPSKSSSSHKQQGKQLTPNLNLGLMLQFKYNILTLHKIYSQLFKQTFVNNKNWQFIVNNYQSLMRQIPNTILSPQQNDKYCHYHNGNNNHQEDEIRNRIIVCEAVRNYRYMIIHQTKLDDKLIRLENIYHKHFLSPAWGYHPGEKISFNSSDQYKTVCIGFLHNNNLNKLPIQILQDFQCLIITHKLSQHNYKIIANIRYKKINSFIPQGKNLIRMKLIGIQQLILQFSAAKGLLTFKEYLNENRNKTREKQLKFINYYLNMYLKDSQRLIQEMYNQQLIGLDVGDNSSSNNVDNNTTKLPPTKKLSFQNIQIQSFDSIGQQTIPQQQKQIINKQNKTTTARLKQTLQQQQQQQQNEKQQLNISTNSKLISWQIQNKLITQNQEIQYQQQDNNQYEINQIQNQAI